MGFAGTGFLYAGVIFNIVRPLLMLTFALISILIYRYVDEERKKFQSIRQRDFIRNTFGRFMSNQVVDQLLDSPEGLEMSGEVREITIMVSDLRGFSSLSSQLSPPEIITILNRYFEHMIEIINAYQGTINEFLGGRHPRLLWGASSGRG